jgi:hypothetical protein
LHEHDHLCGAIYLAGYVVECLLKTLLQRQGKRFVRSGAAGHDLLELWDFAGLRARDLRGHKHEFIQFWKTDLRYDANLPIDVDPVNLLRGGTELAGMVAIRIRHARPTRGKRRP